MTGTGTDTDDFPFGSEDVRQADLENIPARISLMSADEELLARPEQRGLGLCLGRLRFTRRGIGGSDDALSIGIDARQDCALVVGCGVGDAASARVMRCRFVEAARTWQAKMAKMMVGGDD